MRNMAKKSNKISIIGAGAVGATLAQRVLESGLADVVLVDIAKGVAQGKSLDLLDAAPIIGHERDIIGTDDYSHIKSSEIVIITAGFPRKPGMSREDLIAKNAGIVKEVSENVKKYSPEAIVIVVTNPLDLMTYLCYKTTGFMRERVLGMAGVLDSSRFTYLIANELKVPRSSVETYMLGSHGDTMVPVISKTRVAGKEIRKVLSKDKLDIIVKRTCDRGAEIVGLLGSGSAYYSPSAAVFKMLDVILKDSGETLVVSANLEGEYGMEDISIGVPCKIGKNGIEKIIELELAQDERCAFVKSAEAIKKSIKSVSKMLSAI
ncbi:MAG: malate dehydrogenase [Candidatus Omnitrophota bacterium]|nr:malate dehydrogenase [Candidatus Omnitrophota bacterium]